MDFRRCRLWQHCSCASGACLLALTNKPQARQLMMMIALMTGPMAPCKRDRKLVERAARGLPAGDRTGHVHSSSAAGWPASVPTADDQCSLCAQLCVVSVRTQPGELLQDGTVLLTHSPASNQNTTS